MTLKWDFPFPSQRMPVFARNVVATSQPLAAQAGLRMLLRGGNAVDAALSAAIALTVVEPTGNGIGSDAFALVWDGNKLHGLNGSGRSPEAWTPDRFAGCTRMPRLGWNAVTVPGAVDMWSTLSRNFGALPFPELFEPAIDYASQGFMVGPITAKKWSEAQRLYGDFPDFMKTFFPGGRPPLPGDWFHPPGLSNTLQNTRQNTWRIPVSWRACGKNHPLFKRYRRLSVRKGSGRSPYRMGNPAFDPLERS